MNIFAKCAAKKSFHTLNDSDAEDSEETTQHARLNHLVAMKHGAKRAGLLGFREKGFAAAGDIEVALTAVNPGLGLMPVQRRRPRSRLRGRWEVIRNQEHGRIVGTGRTGMELVELITAY